VSSGVLFHFKADQTEKVRGFATHVSRVRSLFIEDFRPRNILITVVYIF